jgi:tetratricopeptide (TPR) repeat protein
MINHYAQADDFAKLAVLYEKLVSLEDNNPNYFINLAKIYAQLGKIEEAIEAVEKSVELDPSLRASAENFIQQLQSATN